ncbi:translation initiation factor IF-2 [Lacticaseibacillus sharpeae]|uniref:Translation initiation factor IF-2 n=1 Tax=Lacticaseibacillus sharpeae JCM 1186 = DSM 20505 TaxID=1291052 RepID=A0A0R1ZXP3_9LACO|nr:translation initiation factor IF-2 [Lacticaseibacillus sharpeae]KRM55708.1 translation initiation factor IF-2 [Lacticaseibacillus sharpeae JCM 1186 = DSM 20505]
MGKKRVYELAKELNISSKDVLAAAQSHGIDVNNNMNSINEQDEKTIKKAITSSNTPEVKTAKAEAKPAAPKQEAPKTAASEPKKQKDEVKPASEVKTGTTHANHVSADGKTKISKNAIRRPGTQRPGTQGNRNRNNGGNQQGQRNNNGQRNANGNQRGGQNGNRNNGSNNGQRNDQRRNNDRNNNNNRGRFNNNQQAAPATRPNPGRAAARAEALRQRQQSEFRTTAAPIGKFEEAPKPKVEPKQAAKPAAQVTPKPAAPKTAAPAAKKQNQNNRPASQNKTSNTAAKPAKKEAVVEERQQKRERNFRSGRQETPYKGKRNKRNRRNQRNNEPKKPVSVRKDRPLPETLVYTEGMNVQDLSKLLHREPAEIIKKLFMLGIMVNQNQSLDGDTIELIATDYGIEAEKKVVEDITDLDKVFEEETTTTENLTPRAPVVTIMGHVDHGKTTLLDKLRHTHVTEGEAGGITQHIGAYQVKLNDRLITFLDTPGHAAFTNMRARGADITDIIVLVVAADDGVMPQTIEAINHAKAANAPIIVAVNKIDKPGANPNHVMEQLSEYELIPEEWGGETIFVQISAKFGKNIDELLEMILMEADMLELKANSAQKAVGTVIEARLDKGKGPVATVLVQQGTLHVGDPVVVGNTFGRIRTMTNDRGRRVKEAGPSMPVEITGTNDVPQSADRFVVFPDEKTARAAGEERAKRALEKVREQTHRVTLDNLFESMKEGQLKEVDVIIKGDVQGSVEAIDGSLRKIDVQGVRVNIIHKAVGAINESDVTLASASNAIIIGFNVRPTAQARAQAETEDVDIRLHSVIYKAIDEVESAMKGMLEPVYEEKIIGSLTVRETIHVSKVGTIAGSYVDTGFITRDAGVRLIRDGIVIHEGKLGSLKRFKDDAKEVRSGFECGLTIDGYNDIKVDDQIEAFKMEEVPVK